MPPLVPRPLGSPLQLAGNLSGSSFLLLPVPTLTSRATHAHPTSPRSTGFCAILDCIRSSSSSCRSRAAFAFGSKAAYSSSCRSRAAFAFRSKAARLRGGTSRLSRFRRGGAPRAGLFGTPAHVAAVARFFFDDYTRPGIPLPAGPGVAARPGAGNARGADDRDQSPRRILAPGVSPDTRGAL